MDPVLDIKARLPIEELVGSYCQLKKKGKGFVCICPFHKDSHPSMQVSPDKGIAYCFACNSGGDIFSFYQKIEGVDFKTALKDLAERTSVKIDTVAMAPSVKPDVKERLRQCVDAALKFYQQQFLSSDVAKDYIAKRKVPAEQLEQFHIGYAPDSFSDTYQYLLKAGFSRQEIIDAGLAVQKDLAENKMYDRFRHRLMFPIHDGNGRAVGFGGRTLGDDDAKYINSSEGPIYNKSTILYGLHHAKDSMRSEQSVVLVEGYFDVLACHRVGMTNVVAVSGTALTEQHVKLLKRYVDKVVLCLDQDRAGKQAAERSFLLCSAEGLAVHAVDLADKDPDEAAAAHPEELQALLSSGGVPYIDSIIQQLQTSDVQSSTGKREALKVLLPLLQAVPSAVEKEHYLGKIAGFLNTTPTALETDLQQTERSVQVAPVTTDNATDSAGKEFSATEIALAIFYYFPMLQEHLSELIEPEDEFERALFHAMKKAPQVEELTVDMLDLSPELRERASILFLYCEHHEFTNWSEPVAAQEIHKNCRVANRALLKRKQDQLIQKMAEARKAGETDQEAKLSQEYLEVLKLAKMSA